MPVETKVYPQFSALITVLADYARSRADARTNTAQGAWLEICTSQDTRKELLEGLDRVELNEEAKQISEESESHEMITFAVAELQHDFIAAIARDLFHMRSPRLGRLYRQSTLDEGYADDNGVFKSVLLRFVETLVSMGTPPPEDFSADPAGERLI